MAQIQPIKTSLEFKEKMSIAASILSGLMFLTTTFGDTFGFDGIAAQIVQILAAFIALINGWFGGVTIQKIIQERKDDEKDKQVCSFCFGCTYASSFCGRMHSKGGNKPKTACGYVFE